MSDIRIYTDMSLRRGIHGIIDIYEDGCPAETAIDGRCCCLFPDPLDHWMEDIPNKEGERPKWL